jgi:hypothetical protein
MTEELFVRIEVMKALETLLVIAHLLKLPRLLMRSSSTLLRDGLNADRAKR